MKNYFKNLVSFGLKNFANLKNEIAKKHQEELNKSEKITKPVSKSNKNQHIMIEFSLLSVFKATILVLIIIAFSKFISEINTIIVLLFISLLLSSILDPTVNALQKKGLPRGLGMIFIYFLALLMLTAFISTLIPLIASQLSELASRLTIIYHHITNNGFSDIPFYEQLKPYLEPYISNLLTIGNQDLIITNLQGAINNIASKLSYTAGNVFSLLIMFFDGLLNLVLVLVLTFFMTVEEKGIENFIKSLFPTKYGEYIVQKSNDVKVKTGMWLRGQILLSLIMGTVVFIGLSIIGVEFALTLGFIEVLAEFVPIIGPFITACAAALIALNEGGWHFFGVIIFFICLHLTEVNLILPFLMGKVVNLNPIAIITAAFIGFHFLGIPGLLLAIPAATVVNIFVKDYIESQK